MGKTILYIAMSLDGYIAGPNEDLQWLNELDDYAADPADAANPYAWDNFFGGIGAIIMGRATYDFEVRHGYDSAHPIPKFVLTHRPPTPPLKPDVTFTAEPIATVLERAKSVTTKNIWVEGGGNVAEQFLNAACWTRS